MYRFCSSPEKAGLFASAPSFQDANRQLLVGAAVEPQLSELPRVQSLVEADVDGVGWKGPMWTESGKRILERKVRGLEWVQVFYEIF